MIYEIRVRPEAENDILEAVFWYQKQLDGLGQDFLNVIQDAFAYLENNPVMFPVVHKDIYRMLVRRFPFGIFYKIEGSLVIVFAVLHASRNPIKWKER